MSLEEIFCGRYLFISLHYPARGNHVLALVTADFTRRGIYLRMQRLARKVVDSRGRTRRYKRAHEPSALPKHLR